MVIAMQYEREISYPGIDVATSLIGPWLSCVYFYLIFDTIVVKNIILVYFF